MSSNEGTPYLIRDSSVEGDDGWVTPEPAEDVVIDAVVGATDLDADAVDDLATAVDQDALAAVLNGEDDAVTFTVEGHDVTVDEDGVVDVDPA